MTMDEPLDEASTKTTLTPPEEPRAGQPVVVAERAVDPPNAGQLRPGGETGSVDTAAPAVDTAVVAPEAPTVDAGSVATAAPAVDAGVVGPEAEASPPSSEPEKRRKRLYVTLPGCWGAVILSCLSFTPSLLPRTGITQGAVWGISAAIGYGLGVLAASIWRAFANRDAPRPRRRQYWQHQLRELMDVTD